MGMLVPKRAEHSALDLQSGTTRASVLTSSALPVMFSGSC